jgi:site-specific DNA recombinase
VSVLSKGPYGYRYLGKVPARGGLPASEASLQVDPQEAEIVRQMFHWIGVDRLSIRNVCRRLEKQGVCAAKGGTRWSCRSVYGMLRNPAYKGTAAYGKRCSGPMRPRPRPPRGAAEQPRRARGWYSVPLEQCVPIPVPPIVTEELFEDVAEQLDENRRCLRLGRRAVAAGGPGAGARGV